MMKRFAFLLWWLAGCDPSPLPATGTQSVTTFRSDVVADDYLLRVRLPPGYDAEPTRAYPLVVQLDPTFVGLKQYATTVGLLSQRAAAGEWPEAIVVGIDYPDPYKRERDYVPPDPPDPTFARDGADRFHRVLDEEILPHLDATYRLEPGRRILVGHSNGAVFAWYETFRHTPDLPPLFSGVIAADAGLDESLFSYERWHAERSTSLPLHLYATRAVYNGASQQIVFRAMVQRLGARGFAGLTFEHEELETDHGGAIAPSFEHGLAAILGGAQ